MPDATVAGYLRLLGMDRPPSPSVEVLTEIHQAHTERVAYNSVDIALGRVGPIEPLLAARALVETGRGGYCFQLNGALSALLAALGFEVRRHRGRVWQDEQDPYVVNHLALTVAGLPTADNPGGGWFVDAGLGDALHEPLPLIEGAYAQGPFTYRLESTRDGWRFHHDPAGSFTGMDFEAAEAAPNAFDEAHARLSTSPDSSFVRKLVVQRRDGTGADKLVSRTLQRVEGTRVVEWDLSRATEWFAALADVFGLTLDDPDDRDRLWQRASDQQEARNASR